jgi:DNA-binding MarR family transcriptional regulator
MRKAFMTKLRALKLRPAEFSTLVLIASNSAVNQKQIGDALEISAPNLVVLMDQLCERGLLERVRSAKDRRAQHPRLTRSGHALIAKAEVLVGELEEEVLAPLTQGERAILIELLRKIGPKEASRIQPE